MIFGLRPEEFAAILALFFTGIILLVPVLALSCRFALKPVIEALAKLRQGNAETTLQDRRIALLEAQVQQLAGELQQLGEADDFRRQLAAPVALEHHA